MASDDSGRQFQSLLQQHRSDRTGVLERDTPFSWTRCFISLFSYALLLSDVLRTGLGTRKNHYPRVEPNQVMFFGPYAYPVAHILKSQTAGAQGIWSFKYDTTSIAMRAYAEFFQLQTWSPCLLYKAPCSQHSLEFSTTFKTTNSLVETMAAFKSRRDPNNLTLRTTNAWKDRTHHFILPQVFREHMTRTNQAIYYGAQLLDSPGFKFCSSRTQVRPYACLDFWTHVAPVCRKSNPLCRGVDRVFQHALTRHRSSQRQYSNMSLDLAVLESQDDHSKPAHSFQGRKFFDIVIITRVRNCSTAQGSLHQQQDDCPTIAIDDYRYEGASITSSVTNWFSIVAALRMVLSISEVVHSARVASIRASACDNSPSFWGLVSLGNTLDAKRLLGSTITLSALLIIAWCWLQALGKLRIAKRIYMFIWPKTRVSFAAGTLWPTNALVVSWNGLLLRTGGAGSGTVIIRRYTQFREKISVLPMEGSSSIFATKHRVNRVNVSPLHIQEASRMLRHDFAILDERSSEVESMIYLTNLAVMTDLVVLLRVWRSRGMKVGVYQSKATRKLFLIPQQAVCSQQDVPIS